MSRPAHPQREEAIAALQAGEQAAVVAARLEIAEATVRAWAAQVAGRRRGERGPDLQPRERRPEEGRALHRDGQTARILELLASGWRPPRIAAELGISASAVRQARARHATELAPAQDPAPPPARRAGQR